MQTPVDIRYAGVVVATANEVRSQGGADLFLLVPEPLPVGTVIGLGADGLRARVERVVESPDADQAGMLVRPLQAGEELVESAPPPVEVSDAGAAAPYAQESDDDTVAAAASGEDLPSARPLPALGGRRRRGWKRHR
jgi:hypothetical protein